MVISPRDDWTLTCLPVGIGVAKLSVKSYRLPKIPSPSPQSSPVSMSIHPQFHPEAAEDTMPNMIRKTKNTTPPPPIPEYGSLWLRAHRYSANLTIPQKISRSGQYRLNHQNKLCREKYPRLLSRMTTPIPAIKSGPNSDRLRWALCMPFIVSPADRGVDCCRKDSLVARRASRKAAHVLPLNQCARQPAAVRSQSTALEGLCQSRGRGSY